MNEERMDYLSSMDDERIASIFDKTDISDELRSLLEPIANKMLEEAKKEMQKLTN